MLEFDEFKSLVSSKLNEKKDLIKTTIKSEIDYIYKNYNKSFERNFMKWNILNKDNYGDNKNIRKIKTWKGQVDYLEKWLLESLEFLCETYN